MPARTTRSTRSTSHALPLAEVLGHGASDKRIDILRRIGEAGSISEAARASGVSYKAAWQALETLANLAGVPLLEKAVAINPDHQRALWFVGLAQRQEGKHAEAAKTWEPLLAKVDPKVIDGAVNSVGGVISDAGEAVRKLQNGAIPTYAFSIFLGVVVVLFYFLFVG